MKVFFYCVDTDARENGEHEVHRTDCALGPEDKIALGPFPSCFEAVQAARRHYKKVNGCQYCCAECYRIYTAATPPAKS